MTGLPVTKEKGQRSLDIPVCKPLLSRLGATCLAEGRILAVSSAKLTVRYDLQRAHDFLSSYSGMEN